MDNITSELNDKLTFKEVGLIRIAIQEKIASLESHILECERYNIPTTCDEYAKEYKDLLDKLK